MTLAEPSRRAAAFVLALIVLAGGGLRMWNLDWDRGAHLHPDERYLAIVSSEVSAPRSVGQWFDTDRSPLNPANHDEQFVYGTAPLFAGKGLAAWLQHGAATGAEPARSIVVTLDLFGVDLLDDAGQPRFDAAYQDVLVGRFLSALLDTATIVVVYLIGRAARGRWVGLGAAVVWATCALAIQHAHFFVVEPMLTFATALALLAAVHVSKGRGRSALGLGAAAAGLAGACKVSGLGVLALLAAAAIVHRWSDGRVAWRADGRTRDRLRRALAPIAIDGALVAVVAFVVFRVLQPYAFEGLFSLDPRWTKGLKELSRIQAGADVPPNVQWADRVPVLESLDHLVRWGWGVPATVLAVVGAWGLWRREQRRGSTPLLLLAGWVLLTFGLFLPRWVNTLRYLLPALPAAAVLAGVGLVGLLTAGRARRIAGTVLLVGAVLWGVGFANGVYGRENTRLVASQWLLQHAPDGAVISADTWDDALPVRSEAATAKGFHIVGLDPFGLTTADDARKLVAQLDQVDYVVESSNRVTDAVSRVPARYATILRYYRALDDGSLGFRRVASFHSGFALPGVQVDDAGSEEAWRVYDHPPVRIWQKTRAFSTTKALALIQPDRAAMDEHVPLRKAGANGLLLREDADARPHGPTFDDVFPDRLPVPWLWWFLWWQVVALAAVPWTSRLFRSLPDRGWGLSKVVGPLAVLIPLWFAVAVGIVRFSAWTVGGATVLALGLGALARWATAPVARAEQRSWLADRWRLVLGIELLGLATFGALLLLRAHDPDLWFVPTGGEKPFNTAYFTAIARSSTFPVRDPWFSGGAMNYYYGGWYVMAAVAKLLGIRPEVALNLSIATAGWLTVSAASSVGAALADLGRRAGRRLAGWGAVLGPVLVLGVGNLDAARQQIDRLTTSTRPVPPIDWWGLSRLNVPTPDVNEFPGWTVLFGDPHPHLLWLPLTVTSVGLLGTYVVARRQRDRVASWGLAGLAGVLLAWARISHTWDLPTQLVLVLAALAAGAALDPDRTRREWRRWAGWRRSLTHGLLIGALALGVSQPYAAAGEVFDSGFTRSPNHTPFGSYLLDYGLALGLVALAVVLRLVRRRRSAPRVLRSPAGLAGGAVLVAGAGLAAAALGGPVLLLAVAVAAVALTFSVLDLRADDLGPGLAWAVVAAGAGLSALAEVYVVRNDLDRMNTVFKFGFTAWVLLAVGAGGVVTSMLRAARRPRLLGAVVGLGLVPGLLFWPSAIGPRLDARFKGLPLTLDGREWLRHGPVEVEANGVPRMDVTADNAMIAWFRRTVPASATIVEEVGTSYTWVGRISVATGQPTVLGWHFHQTQQRRGYGASVEARAAAVEAFYADADPEQQLRFLAAYRPDYIVVGTVERALGTPAAVDGIGTLVGVRRAWSGDHGEVVYCVDHRLVDQTLARLDAVRLQQDPPVPPPA